MSARRSPDHGEDRHLSLAELLAHLDIAADAASEDAERALEAVRAHIRKLPPAARAQLGSELVRQRLEAGKLHADAVAERTRQDGRLLEWVARESEPVAGVAERIAEHERAVRDAEAVVYEYDELIRMLDQLAALI